MKKPGEGTRSLIYLVKPEARGEWFGTAGSYVGETPDYVVLRIGEAVKGFKWADVEPVEMKATGD